MSICWTHQHVATLAPDAASLKAGEKLGMPAKWQTLGIHDAVIWGEIRGSGKKPYQTSIVLSEPAFKCSCPSRKFPCKHAIALALVFASSSSDFTEANPLDWVQEWLDKREARAKTKAAKADAKTGEVDEATQQKRELAQQKRSIAREQKVDAGIAELQRWLLDLIRQGIVSSETQPWQHLATRMIDSQAPGIARRLQLIEQLRYQHKAWQVPTLNAIAKLHLLASAWQRRDALPKALQSDIRTHIGFPTNKETLLTEPSISDHWQVLGQSQEDEGQMQSQLTWLYAQTQQKYALLLDFSGFGQTLPLYPAVGESFQATLVYYPSASPQRAALTGDISTKKSTAVTPNTLPLQTIDEALSAYAGALTACPWLIRHPMLLGSVFLAQVGEAYCLVSDTQKSLPLAINDDQYWSLLACSGGNALHIFGIWDGAQLQPLSAWQDGVAKWLIMDQLAHSTGGFSV